MLAAFLATAGAAASRGGELTGSAGKEPRYRVVATASAVTVDGVLDEAAWADATVIPLVFETRPGENVDPAVATDCLITYDRERLYVAFRAEDPDPSKIRARFADRDAAFSDDFVGIAIDTFNDERRAFEFFVNPKGVQMDAFYDDVNDDEDTSWDAIWSSAGAITAEGFVVEIAVPFSSIRFPRTAGPQTWGIDILRFYPRGTRYRISNNPQDRSVSCYLCQLMKVEGFEGISPGRNLEIVPTATVHATEQRDEDADGFPELPLDGGDADADPGITLRWGITPNLTLGGTVNPDFSQVEADVAQLDVNEQFALFFPEKRPFFLEGKDFFSTPLDAVFTRNVADPSWGVKLTGKQGPHALGAFVAEDEVTNLLLPGSQGSESTSLDLATTDTVLRFRSDLGEASALGVLATSREGDGYSNRVLGVDALYQPTDSDVFRAQILGSRTEYPSDVVAEFDQPEGTFDDTALLFSYSHNERDWDAFVHYEDLGPDFRADMGFLPRVDTRFLLAGAGRTWWRDGGGWYDRLRLGTDVDVTRDHAGRELEREYQVFAELNGRRESFYFLTLGTRDRFFDGVHFEDERFVDTWFEMRANGSLHLSFGVGAGDDIDFANTRPAEMLRFEPGVRYDFGEHLRARLSHNYRKLTVDEGDLFEARLSQLHLTYQLNLRTFFRTVLQYTDVTRDPTLYEDDVEARTERLFTQLLFSYKLNPQTVLFVGYSDRAVGNEAVDLTSTNRTLFLKLGYAWVL